MPALLFDKSRSPAGGLKILLLAALSVAFVLLCVAVLPLDRLKQHKVDRMKEKNGIDGLIDALQSPWPGRKAARASCRALGETGGDRAVEHLIRALDD